MAVWQRRLMVVEDEPMVASLLAEVLMHAGFEVRCATEALQASALVEEFDPDGALIDINLGPGPTGLHLGHLLQRTHPEIGLVFLTKYHDPRVAGGEGWRVPEGSAFLSKDRITDTGLLTRAVESVLTNADQPERHDRQHEASLQALTVTQLEILRLAALGLTNTAIAKRRGTNERTVEQRLQSVYQALEISITPELNPRVEAIRKYIAAVGLPTESLTEDD